MDFFSCVVVVVVGGSSRGRGRTITLPPTNQPNKKKHRMSLKRINLMAVLINNNNSNRKDCLSEVGFLFVKVIL